MNKLKNMPLCPEPDGMGEANGVELQVLKYQNQ